MSQTTRLVFKRDSIGKLSAFEIPFEGATLQVKEVEILKRSKVAIITFFEPRSGKETVVVFSQIGIEEER